MSHDLYQRFAELNPVSQWVKQAERLAELSPFVQWVRQAERLAELNPVVQWAAHASGSLRAENAPLTSKTSNTSSIHWSRRLARCSWSDWGPWQ